MWEESGEARRMEGPRGLKGREDGGKLQRKMREEEGETV
jgi:hypothetical protein